MLFPTVLPKLGPKDLAHRALDRHCVLLTMVVQVPWPSKLQNLSRASNTQYEPTTRKKPMIPTCFTVLQKLLHCHVEATVSGMDTDDACDADLLRQQN
jgi:hypothetical protein